ncbi:MAG: ribonuclease H-like domain-containing protein [Lachnospiraceae bacterium]|nr:ribonuclease H-like domain-containing protein [Lachnospiraceae bacterium]
MEDALLFDIETTGFSPAHSQIYLVGTAALTGSDEYTVTQYFAEDASDEAAVLRAFIDEAGLYETLISFNGEAFDIPFIQKRASAADMIFTVTKSIDLYRETRKITPVFPMKSRKLKSIEQFFGVFREDTYSGGDLIRVWQEYTIDNDPEKEKNVLLHNEEDVADMFPVLSILELERLLDADICVERIVLEKDGTLTFAGRSGIRTPTGFTLVSKNAFFAFRDEKIQGSIRPETGKKKYFFGNPKAYAYLISEEKVIPKALASALPKSAVRKARMADCYAEEEGFFWLLPSKNLPEGERPYRDTFESQEYFLKKETENVDEAWLSSYVSLLVSCIMKGLC